MKYSRDSINSTLQTKVLTDKFTTIRQYYFATVQNTNLFNEVEKSEYGLRKETMGTLGYKCDITNADIQKSLGLNKNGTMKSKDNLYNTVHPTLYNENIYNKRHTYEPSA